MMAYASSGTPRSGTYLLMMMQLAVVHVHRLLLYNAATTSVHVNDGLGTEDCRTGRERRGTALFFLGANETASRICTNFHMETCASQIMDLTYSRAQSDNKCNHTTKLIKVRSFMADAYPVFILFSTNLPAGLRVGVPGRFSSSEMRVETEPVVGKLGR